ncbi:ABC transporter substrate-binding protein [Paenibacillus sp. GYB003]|uniref:ABC transporter substrate-binding protein n=1 Tax=Paenibacillus sp. GYB003 TaxID=2994392 RepID=UPI002F969522
MKRNRKKLLLAGAIASVLLASACGNPSAPEADGRAGGNNEAKPAPAAKPIDLVFYQPSADWDEERFMKEFGEPIKAKFPHITPKFIKYNGKADQVTELVTTGTQVDIMFMSVGQIYNFLLKSKMERDLTPLIQKSGFDLTRFEATSVDILKQIGGGKLYGIPMYTLPATIYYNKDLFDKFGVAYPKDGMTWDDTYELSRKLTRQDGGVQYYGTVMSPSHLAMRNQLSLNLIDPQSGKATLNNDAWNKFVANVSRFYTIPGYDWTNADMQVGKQRDLFTKEKRAAMWMPVSTMHTAAELQGMNWDLASFPVLKEAPGTGPQAYPFYFFVTATSKTPEEAFDVLAYLSGEAFHLDKSKKGVFLSLLKNDAVRKSFGQQSDMYKGKNTKAMLPETFAAPSYVSTYTSTAAGKIFSALVNVTTGKQDVNTALREAEETMNQTIEAEKSK